MWLYQKHTFSLSQQIPSPISCLKKFFKLATKEASSGSLPDTVFSIADTDAKADMEIASDAVIMIGRTQIMHRYHNDLSKTQVTLYENIYGNC